VDDAVELQMIYELGEVYREEGIVDDLMSTRGCQTFSPLYAYKLIRTIGMHEDGDVNAADGEGKARQLLGQGDCDGGFLADDKLAAYRCSWLSFWFYWLDEVEMMSAMKALEVMTDSLQSGERSNGTTPSSSLDSVILARTQSWLILQFKLFDAGKGDDEGPTDKRVNKRNERKLRDKLMKYINQFGVWCWSPRLNEYRLWRKEVSCF